MENKIDLKYQDLLTDTSLKSLSEFSLYKSIEVTVNCTTYNHANYIKRCLDSLLSQKVNFGVQILVHDDASTDGTSKIVKEYAEKYPNIIIPIIEEENQYSKDKHVIELKYVEKFKGKYIATCEGDDYWTDSYKLALQYQLMEEHKECSLCVHKVKSINVLTNKIRFYPRNEINSIIFSNNNYFKLINSGYAFQTSSYFRRGSDYVDYVLNKPLFVKIIPTGDEASLLFYGTRGKVLYINKTMSIYNYLNPDSWSSNFSKIGLNEKLDWLNKWEKGLVEFNNFTNKKYNKIIKTKIYNLKFHNLYNTDEFRKIFKQFNFKLFLLRHHFKNYWICVFKYHFPRLYKKIKKI